MIYKPAKGSRLSEEQAQRYGQRIYDLVEERDGIILAEDVLKDARDDGSPLHDFFEWDDSEAAEHWRLNQARYLLRSIHVVLKNDEGEEEQTRFTYNVTDTPDDDGEGQRVYCTIQRVLTDDEIRAQVVEQAMRQLQSWRDRPDYFENLSLIREFGLRHGTPPWNIILAAPHLGYRDPTTGELRWQVYTSLAYGMKGIL